MTGREKIQMAAAAMSKIENLNAIVHRTNKQKSRVKMLPNLSLYPTMKMDYSTIHKENEILEENLEDHLVHIKKTLVTIYLQLADIIIKQRRLSFDLMKAVLPKRHLPLVYNQRKAMEEKGEELEEMRRQMEVITKLQDAVNSRNPGDSTDILSNDRAARLGRQWAGDNKPNRALLKIEAERNKFSSKNLFNVRRFRKSSGFDFITSRKFIPSSAMQIPSDNEEEHTDKKKESTASPPQKSNEPRGYLKETFSSLAGFRPTTAAVTYQREQKEDDILPPRSKSAVLRSRSRRQLELLCRVTPTDTDLEVTPDFKIDWKVVNEKHRRRKLQELREEQEGIQNKVHSFLSEVDLFNKRPISGKPTELKSAAQTHVSENHSDSKETLSRFLESETTFVHTSMSGGSSEVTSNEYRPDSANMSTLSNSRA